MAAMPVTTATSLPDATCWHLADYLSGRDEWITAIELDRSFSIRPLLAIKKDRIQRLSFEARVLAYRDIDLAAKASRIPTQVAHDYCSIFFDVANRLQAKGAIGCKVINATGERDDIVRCEMFSQAYFGGPLVVEHWLTSLPFLGSSVQHDLNTLEGIDREQLDLAVASRGNSDKFYDPTLLAVRARLLGRQRQSRTYADCVVDHVADVLATNWQQKPSKATREIVELRSAA